MRVTPRLTPGVRWMSSLLLAAAAAPGLADTQTQALNISATVVGTCSLTGTSSSLTFANITAPTTTPPQANGILNITCTNGTGWSVYIPSTANDAGPVRRLAFGGNYLSYNLLLDTSTGTPVPMTAGSFTGTGTGGPQTRDLFAVLQANVDRTSPAGNYSTSLLVSIDYTP